MSYTKHNFQSGDILYANQLNAMEDQIAANETAAAAAAAAAAAKYTKPSGGIPETDLADAVRTKLNSIGQEVNAAGSGGSTVTVDSALSDSSENPVQNRVVKAALDTKGTYSKPSGGIPETDLADAVKSKLNEGGLSSAVKTALLAIAQHVAYTDANGASYYQALSNALDTAVSISSISAVLSLGNVTVYDYQELDAIKPYLTVTAHYSNGTGAVLSSGYTLNLPGGFVVGSNSVTVVYEGLTTTVTVPVASALPSGYTRLQYVTADGNQYINTGLHETAFAVAEYEVSYSSITSKGGHILSAHNIYFPFVKGSSSEPKLMANNGNHEIDPSDYAFALNTRYVLSGFPEIKINGTTVTTLTRGANTNNEKYYSFFTYGSSPSSTQYRFFGNLYYAKLWDGNGTLTHYYLPVKNSSNVAGLYDVIGGAFYHSDSGTELIAGSEVA